MLKKHIYRVIAYKLIAERQFEAMEEKKMEKLKWMPMRNATSFYLYKYIGWKKPFKGRSGQRNIDWVTGE